MADGTRKGIRGPTARGNGHARSAVASGLESGHGARRARNASAKLPGSRRRRNQHDHRLTRGNVADTLERLVAAAGVTVHDTGGKGRVTPHGIRRTHAKTLAEHGADLLDISESLRHKDTRVTRTSYIGEATGRANMARQRVSDILTNMSG